jgi:hypothetical protein
MRTAFKVGDVEEIAKKKEQTPPPRSKWQLAFQAHYPREE